MLCNRSRIRSLFLHDADVNPLQWDAQAGRAAPKCCPGNFATLLNLTLSTTTKLWSEKQ